MLLAQRRPGFRPLHVCPVRGLLKLRRCPPAPAVSTEVCGGLPGACSDLCIFSSRLPPLLECAFPGVGPLASPWAPPSAQTLSSPGLCSSQPLHPECSSPSLLMKFSALPSKPGVKGTCPRKAPSLSPLRSMSLWTIVFSPRPVNITTCSELKWRLALSLISTVALWGTGAESRKAGCPRILAHVITTHTGSLRLLHCIASEL